MRFHTLQYSNHNREHVVYKARYSPTGVQSLFFEKAQALVLLKHGRWFGIVNSISKQRKQVTSVERALSILEILASRNHGLSTSEISRVAKVPKSSTSYLLRTLVGRGYVRRDLETGQHTLGIRVLSLGGQAMQGMALRELAMPHLRQIAESTRLGSHLAILDHGDAVYIERIESPGFIKMDIWNGKRVAPQATAVGKALICHLSREE